MQARAEEPLVSTEKGAGLSASLVSSGTRAELNWRLLRTTKIPITSAASVNGRVLEPTTESTYPGPRSRSAVLLVLDIGDPKRSDQIERDKLALFAIVSKAKPNDKLSVALYADSLSLVQAKERNVGTIVNQIATARARPVPSHLGSALVHAIELLSGIVADRKAIFVLTDGHSDDRLDASLLSFMARGMSINFILATSERTADMARLRELAAGTGGLVTSNEAEREQFLADPFRLVDSGGRVEYSLAAARRYYWEPTATFEVRLKSGGGTLALKQVVGVPRASLGEHLVYLFSRPRIRYSVPATLLVLAVPALYFGLRRWRRRRRFDAPGVRQPGERAPVSAASPTSGAPAAAGAANDEAIPSCEEMWERLKVRVSSRLSSDPELMTAIEIAEEFGGATGDMRLKQFVQDFYYPRVYGRESAKMSDAAAFGLMKSILA